MLPVRTGPDGDQEPTPGQTDADAGWQWEAIPAPVMECGYKLFPTALFFLSRPTPSEQLLAALLWHRFNEDPNGGRTYGQRHLAAELRTDRRNMQRSVRRLQKCGLVGEVEQDDDGRNVYHLRMWLPADVDADVRSRYDTLPADSEADATEPEQEPGIRVVLDRAELLRYGMVKLPNLRLWDERLSPAHLRLLGIVWHYFLYGGYGAYFGGVRWLAVMTGQNVRTVKRHLQYLVSLGHLKRRQRWSNQTAVYTPGLDASAADLEACQGVTKHLNGAVIHNPGVSEMTPPGCRKRRHIGVGNDATCTRNIDKELGQGVNGGRKRPVQVYRKRKNRRRKGNGNPGRCRVTAGQLRTAVLAARSDRDLADVLHRAGANRDLADELAANPGLKRFQEKAPHIPDAGRKGDGYSNPLGWLIRAAVENWSMERPGQGQGSTTGTEPGTSAGTDGPVYFRCQDCLTDGECSLAEWNDGTAVCVCGARRADGKLARNW